jgi:membrane-bound lytic murein transglycosylase D
MIKRTSLSLLAVLCYTQSEAQEIPSTMTVGSVKVKIDADARILISKEIAALNSNRKYAEAMLRRMAIYFPIIEKELKEEGVPDEFKYLCAVESGLFPDQISTSNAVGFWQFKQATAVEAGLRVDEVVDERRHIQASTKAMAIYLTRSNLILHNWVSSLLSYRSGLSAVRKMSNIDWAYKKEINATGSTDAYIIRFLAYRHFLEKEYQKIKYEPVSTYLLEYSNTRGKSVKAIAAELGVSVSEIIVNNTWLKSTTIPDDKDYTVYLTADVDRYVELKSTIQKLKSNNSYPSTPNQDLGFPVLVRLTQEPSQDGDPIYYEINGIKGILAVSGDTPESIANRAGINVNKFIKYNDISMSERIISGDVYYLKKKKSRAEIAYHTVQGSETLWKVSQMYGIQLNDLLSKNRLAQVQRLQKGRLLYLRESRPEMQSIEYVQIPEEPVISYASPLNNNVKTVEVKEDPVFTTYPSESSSTKAAASEVKDKKYENDGTGVKQIFPHVVQPRESYYSIARAYNMTPSELYRLNNITSTNVLHIGDIVKVFGTQSSTGAIQAANRTVEIVSSFPSPSPTRETEAGPVIILSSGNKEDESAAYSTEQPSGKFRMDGKPITHRVASKQNLYRISLLYNVSVAEIRQWNGLKDNNVLKDQELIIYQAGNNNNQNNITTGYNEGNIHVVQTGETVYHIADTYNMKVSEVVRMNKIRGFLIKPGQRLVISK